MTIYEIKRRVTNAPHYFSRSNMKFFGQTLKSFSVVKLDDVTYRISAPMKDSTGRVVSYSVRLFNVITNEFSMEVLK